MSTPTTYSSFLQSAPKLNNEYTDDIFLQDYLKTYFPSEGLKEITPDLIKLGKRTANEFIDWARDAEINEPKDRKSVV